MRTSLTRRAPGRGPAVVAATALLTGALTALTAPVAAVDSYTFTSTQNPILGDGSYYSADPAPLVVPAGAPGNDTGADQLYVYTGHDEASPTRNDFVMNEWGAFVTADPDRGQWTHYPSLMRPETVFSWASSGRAYAGQVVQGPDERYYWYVPVYEGASPASDKFAIGVAVSDTPVGPWTDWAGAPIISQRVPQTNAIQNIDPTVWVDGEGDDARVYVYWGSFGSLRLLELAPDMRTPIGPERSISGLTGFFEAPWLFEREGTYYLLYAGNNAGPTSSCTPASYHACIGYGTAPSPTGPWTYRGTVLGPVSSTTSHPGLVELDGRWWLAYHTADAAGGGHFRRSVAIDEVQWDDTQTPPRILPVTPTPVTGRDLTPRANIAQEARVTVSNEPVPTQYWVKALNDEIVRPNPLPPDMWATWTADDRPPQQWVQYTWDQPVRVSGSQIDFWSDSPAGSGAGVAPPASWRLQYWDASGGGAWVDVPHPSGYPTGTSGLQDTTFDPVTTTQVRALFDASTDGRTYAAVAVEEWKVLADQPKYVWAAPITVEVGETDLPGTVEATYADGSTLDLPAYWDALSADDVARPGRVAVEGTVLGYAAGRVPTRVTVIDPDDVDCDDTPPTVTFAPVGSAGAAGWFRSAVTVHVTAQDDSGTRVTLTTRLDDGEPVVAGPVRSTDVTVAGDGSHTVTAQATDRAGNSSPQERIDVRIDATAPVSTATVDPGTREVTLAATDATSGVAGLEYALDGGAWVPYTEPVAAPDGNRHTVLYRATDTAGNTENARAATVPADLSGPLSGNVAPLATATASYTAGWNSLTALNDDQDPANPSQAQIWGTWTGNEPESRWIQYTWSRPIRLTSSELKFWADSAQGSGVGVAQPDSWELEYWDDAAERWVPVGHPSPAGTSTTQFSSMTFDPVTTSRLRAVIHANGNGTAYSAVAVTEWRVLAEDPGTQPPGPDLAITVTAEPRCLAGQAVLAVRALNGEDAPVDVTLTTPFGAKVFTAVAPGANAYQSFATRTVAVEAGSATVTVTGTVDGQPATQELVAAYAATSCG